MIFNQQSSLVTLSLLSQSKIHSHPDKNEIESVFLTHMRHRMPPMIPSQSMYGSSLNRRDMRLFERGAEVSGFKFANL